MTKKSGDIGSAPLSSSSTVTTSPPCIKQLYQLAVFDPSSVEGKELEAMTQKNDVEEWL